MLQPPIALIMCALYLLQQQHHKHMDKKTKKLTEKSKQRRTKKQTNKRIQGKIVKTIISYEYVTSIQTFIALLQRPSELPHNALVVFSGLPDINTVGGS